MHYVRPRMRKKIYILKCLPFIFDIHTHPYIFFNLIYMYIKFGPLVTFNSTTTTRDLVISSERIVSFTRSRTVYVTNDFPPVVNGDFSIV